MFTPKEVSNDFVQVVPEEGLNACCVGLLEILPNSKTFKLIENQLGRAALSVGANYRVVSRAKSSNDFINKLKIVEEECDECTFFLEILLEKTVNHKEIIQKLLSEANEILAIIVASIKSARNNKS